MDITILRAELTNDPLTRGYAGMTADAAATSLNTANRVVNRSSVSTAEIFEAIVPSEYDALTAAQKERVRVLLSLGSVLVNGANAQATLLGAFGVGTTSRTNLIAVARETVSRAVELGLGRIKPGYILEARA